MEIFTIEFYIVLLLIIDLIFIALIIFFLRKMKTNMQKEASTEAANQVMAMMNPLFKEADIVAQKFESQINEKNRLISSLNEKLDHRIIDLKLYLERTELLIGKGEEIVDKLKESQKKAPVAPIETKIVNKDISKGPANIYEQQEMIFDLHNQGYDAEIISEKMSVLKKEVELVLALKKKLMTLERKS